jgi:hypothetical protein
MSRLPVVLLLSLLASSPVTMASTGALPIMNDDVARARAEAARRHVPVFVEVWAPW